MQQSFLHFGCGVGLQVLSSQVEHSRTKAGIPFHECGERLPVPDMNTSVTSFDLHLRHFALKSHRLIRFWIRATANWILVVLVVLSAWTLCRHRVHVSSPSLFQVELRNTTSWIETTLCGLVSDACHGKLFSLHPC